MTVLCKAKCMERTQTQRASYGIGLRLSVDCWVKSKFHCSCGFVVQQIHNIIELVEFDYKQRQLFGSYACPQMKEEFSLSRKQKTANHLIVNKQLKKK